MAPLSQAMDGARISVFRARVGKSPSYKFGSRKGRYVKLEIGSGDVLTAPGYITFNGPKKYH